MQPPRSRTPASLVTPEPYETVDENIVRALPALVEELGGDPATLLQKVGLSLHSFMQGETAANYRQAVQLVALAASELQCDDFGMRLAKAQAGTIRSPLVQVIENAKTLDEALRLVCAHSYAHSRAVAIWLHESELDETVAYGLDILLEGLPNRSQAMEQILLIAYSSIRELTGEMVRARCITFRHEQISPMEVYRRYFGCEVKFGKHADAILFNASDLQCPVFRRSDDVQAAIAAIEKRFPDRQSPVHATVRGILMRSLGAEGSAVTDVARSMGCSVKKLSRMLSAEGVSFQAIKNNLRVEIAQYYIEDTDIPLAALSERMGFSEQSALSHFCRKWLGASPSQLRERKRHPAA